MSIIELFGISHSLSPNAKRAKQKNRRENRLCGWALRSLNTEVLPPVQNYLQYFVKGPSTQSVFRSVFLLRSFCFLALAISRFLKKILLLSWIFVILDVLHLFQAKKFRESCCKCPNAKRAKRENRRENRLCGWTFSNFSMLEKTFD